MLLLIGGQICALQNDLFHLSRSKSGTADAANGPVVQVNADLTVAVNVGHPEADGEAVFHVGKAVSYTHLDVYKRQTYVLPQDELFPLA